MIRSRVPGAGLWWIMVLACGLLGALPALAYGPGTATVATVPEPIRAGLGDCELNFTIRSDGVNSINRLTIEVGLEWVTPKLTTPGNVTATLGNGADLTANLSLGTIGGGPHGGTLLTLDPALVTPWGSTSRVEISFTEQRGPGSQGVYPWYVQTAAASGNPLEDILVQPEVEVIGVAADGYGVATISATPVPLIGGMQDTTVTIELTNDAPTGTSTQDIFTTWTVYGDGLWQLVGGILQCANNSNQPTYFISDEILYDAIIYFEIRVNSTTDDDFIGWVFRFQDPENFYVFDWKQLTQETAPIGRALKRIVDGDFNGDGVPHDDPASIWEGRPEYNHVMVRDSVGWSDYTWYPCKIEMIGEQLNLYVTDMTTPALQVSDPNFTSGRIGPYTYSQPYTQFRNIAVERLTSYIESITIEIPQGWSDPDPGVNLAALRGDGLNLTSLLTTGTSGGGPHGGTVLTLGSAHLATTSPSNLVTFTYSPADVALRGGTHTFYTQTSGADGILTDIVTHPAIQVYGTLADGTGTATIQAIPASVYTGGVNQYLLTVSSAGVYPLDSIVVTVPTGFSTPTSGSVSAMRGDGVDLTANLTFNGMNVLLSDADIQTTGLAAYVVFTFNNVTASSAVGYHIWAVATAGLLGILTPIADSPEIYVSLLPTPTPVMTPTATPTVNPNIWVPDDYPSIQQAIDNADNGFTIWVRNGTFEGGCNFGGLQLLVRSENGPVNCLIDCGGVGNAFTFNSDEGLGSIVQGFTIQNGNSPLGGAILCDATSPTIRNCIITANTAENGGGIACVNNSAPLITTNTISGNYASGNGGGIYGNLSAPVIVNNAITGNASANDGGGTYLDGQTTKRSDPEVLNCIIADNVAVRGAGIFCTNNIALLTSNTHTTNSASAGGSGLYCMDASPMVTNCLLWNDVTDEIATNAGSTPTVTYCSVQGGYAGVGNVEADPYFIRGYDGFHYLSSTESGQIEDSACIDAGSELASNISFIGPDGYPLYLNELHTRTDKVEDAGIVDIGFHYCACIPHAPQIIRVPTDFEVIQDAIDYALNGDIVVVADGTYEESINVSGKAITITSQNGPQYTVINVNYHGPGFYFVRNEGPDSIIIGFTILRGGAGVVCNHASPTISNCRIQQCETAVECTNQANPTISNCVISQNTNTAVTCNNSSPTISECIMTENTGTLGGAVSCTNSSSPTITTSTISNNSADQGGAIYVANSTNIVMTNCIMSDNQASNGGGGMHLIYGDLVVVNFLITGCSAQYGGAIFCYYSAPQLTNCTLSNNAASSAGGAFYCINSSPYVHNCILWNDTPDEIVADAQSSPDVTYSNVQGAFTGEGNINTDPLFTYSPGPGSYYYLSHILCGQPADSPSINAGGDPVGAINFIGPDGSTMHMSALSTRTDAAPDADVIDQGFHDCACVPVPPPPPAAIPATGPLGVVALISLFSILIVAIRMNTRN